MHDVVIFSNLFHQLESFKHLLDQGNKSLYFFSTSRNGLLPLHSFTKKLFQMFLKFYFETCSHYKLVDTLLRFFSLKSRRYTIRCAKTTFEILHVHVTLLLFPSRDVKFTIGGSIYRRGREAILICAWVRSKISSNEIFNQPSTPGTITVLYRETRFIGVCPSN